MNEKTEKNSVLTSRIVSKKTIYTEYDPRKGDVAAQIKSNLMSAASIISNDIGAIDSIYSRLNSVSSGSQIGFNSKMNKLLSVAENAVESAAHSSKNGASAAASAKVTRTMQKTETYKVYYEDGKESNRELISVDRKQLD